MSENLTGTGGTTVKSCTSCGRAYDGPQHRCYIGETGLPNGHLRGEVTPNFHDSVTVTTPYDPVPDYVTRLLMEIRRGQKGAAREMLLVSAAIFGIPTLIGLIYWYL